MKKIALTTAAFLLTAGTAFAQSVAVAPSYNDAGYLPTDNLSTQSAHGFGATLSSGSGAAVAHKYNDAGYLPTDVVGARSTAIKPVQVGSGVAVAPAYNDAGYLPTDAR